MTETPTTKAQREAEKLDEGLREMAREAVAQFLERDGGWTTGYVSRIRSGVHDGDDKIALWELGYQAGLLVRNNIRPKGGEE